jgi:hypothetical protein
MARKKRKTAEHNGRRNNEQAKSTTPLIEGLEAMTQLKNSWPLEVESMFNADMEQVHLSACKLKVASSHIEELHMIPTCFRHLTTIMRATAAAKAGAVGARGRVCF